MTINWWLRASGESFQIEMWHLSQPTEGREPLEFFEKFDPSKDVSFLVGTIDTFCSDDLRVLLHY